MIKSKKLLVVLLLISYSMSMIAQTSYYYREQKIPLFVNDNKVCVNIPKSRGDVSDNILKKSKVAVSIIASDFAPGIYIYSLIVDGKCVSSKRMIVTR